MPRTRPTWPRPTSATSRWKPSSPFDGAAGSAEIVVDGDDRLSRPAEMERPVDQRILELGQFLVALNLLRRRLTNVDDRQSLLMLSRDLLGREADPTRQQIPVHITCPLRARWAPDPTQGQLRQQQNNVPTPLRRQRLPKGLRRGAAHDAIQASARLREAPCSPESATRGILSTYKRHLLWDIERAFRCLKTVDLDIRPIRHWTAERVRAHVFLCMLAYHPSFHEKLDRYTGGRLQQRRQLD